MVGVGGWLWGGGRVLLRVYFNIYRPAIITVLLNLRKWTEKETEGDQFSVEMKSYKCEILFDFLLYEPNFELHKVWTCATQYCLNEHVHVMFAGARMLRLLTGQHLTTATSSTAVCSLQRYGTLQLLRLMCNAGGSQKIRPWCLKFIHFSNLM